MKFKKEDLIAITEDDAPDGFEIIEEGDWISEGKYECREIIFKFEEKFYSLNESRSGSHYTDWYYCSEDWDDYEDCAEVKPVEKTIIKWEVVK